MLMAAGPHPLSLLLGEASALDCHTTCQFHVKCNASIDSSIAWPPAVLPLFQLHLLVLPGMVF